MTKISALLPYVQGRYRLAMVKISGSGAAKGLLLIFGTAFLLLGVRYFADPAALTSESDVALPSAKAIMEIRTIYGGMFTGLGVLLWVMALGRDLLRAGLLTLICVAGIVAIARILAILLGQAPDAIFAFLLVIEITGVALALALLRRLPR